MLKTKTGAGSEETWDQAWLRHFHAVKQPHDASSAKITVLLLVAWSPLLLSGRGPALFAVTFAAMIVAMLAAVRQPWYPAWREWVIDCRQMITVVSFYALVMRSEPFLEYLEPPPGATFLHSLRSLSMMPLLVLAVGASYATPVRSKRVILAAAMAACVPTSAAVCRTAAAAEPSRFLGLWAAGVAPRRYQAMLAAAEGLARGIVPIQVVDIVSPAGRAHFDAPALSEFGACMAVHVSLQAAVGFFLPLAILAADEAVARAAFERNQLHSTGFSYSLRAATALHVGLAVMQAAAAFHGIVRALHLVGLAGLAPTLVDGLV